MKYIIKPVDAWLFCCLLTAGVHCAQPAEVGECVNGEACATGDDAPRWVDLQDDMTRADLAYYELQRYGPPGTKDIKSAFRFPADADAASIYGVDVSHHNGRVDWQALGGKGIRFVYIKTSQGDMFRDAQFAANWQGVAGLPGVRRGAYHFLTANAAGKAQAKSFLALLNSAGGLAADDLAPVADLEWDFDPNDAGKVDRWGALTPNQIVQLVTEWAEAVKSATGRTPIIYTAASWWKSRLGTNMGLRAYPQWLADYRPDSIVNGAPLQVKQHILVAWQFTDGGRVAGGPPKLDVDRVKGQDMAILTGR